MRGIKRKLFTLAAVTSAILCAGTVVLWVRSFRGDSHVSVNALGARYTVQSTWGRLVLVGPPGEGADDPVAAEIASRMSGDDFDWGPPLERREGWRVRGDVRRGTATWEMFQRFHDRLPDTTGMEPATRVWLKALDDPRAFVPATLFLSLWFDRWREATVWDGVPAVYVPVVPGTNRPQLGRRAEVRDEWYDRVARPRVSVFDGWIVAAMLVLPIAWVARPRRSGKGRGRLAVVWAFNGAAVASLLLCVVGATAWVRSYWVADYWFFAPRPRNTSIPFGGRQEPIASFSHVASSAGRIALHENVAPQVGRAPIGPYLRMHPAPLTVGWSVPGTAAAIKGDRHWTAPGIEFFYRDLQEINFKRPPTPGPVPKWQASVAEPLGPPAPSSGSSPSTVPAAPLELGPVGSVSSRPATASGARPLRAARTPPTPFTLSGPMLVGGERALVISWWLPVLCGTVLPAVWARSTWGRWRRARRERRRDLCPSCGYDLRATPERCPECGRVAANIDTSAARG